jgi:cytoskeletal protein RodZ
MGVDDPSRPSVGATLKARREERGETFRDVENATKIRTRYLAALEDDDIELLPAEVYALGFLRSYARHLGLDAESLVRTWRARLAEQAAEPGSLTTSAPPPPTFEAPPVPVVRERSRRTSVRPPRPGGVAAAAVVLILILVAIVYGLHHHTPVAPAAASSETHVSHHSKRHHHRAAASSGPALATTVDTPSQLTMTIKNATPSLTLAFNGNCWVEVWVNGVTSNPYGHTYTSGQTFSVSGSQSVEVRLGNPGVVAATVNGKTLGPISQGTVRNLLIETTP